MTRDALPRHSGSQFAIGDRVIVKHDSLVSGRIGLIGRRAHPATPWTWVVYNLPGDTFWGTAVNEADIEHDLCGRLLVGQGSDTYDPVCVLPKAHDGLCKPEENADA